MSGRAARIAATTGTIRRELLVLVDRRRGPAGSIRRRRRAGRRPRRPSRRACATAAARPDRAGLVAASSPSPENESGVTLTMPITNVRSPQRTSGRRSRCRRAAIGRWAVGLTPLAGHATARLRAGRGVVRVRSAGIVDEAAPGPRRRDRASRRRRSGPARPAEGLRRGPRPAAGRRSRPDAPAGAAPRAAASSSAGSARGRRPAVQITRRRRAPRLAARARDDARHVLVGHRPDDQGQRRRLGARSPPARNGRRSSSAWARAAAPAGLWAPSSRTSRPAWPASISSSRPAQRASAIAARRASGPTVGDPGRRPGASRIPSATATLAAWWRPRSPTRVSPRPGSSTTDPVAVPAEQRRRRRDRQRGADPRRASPDHAEPVAVGAGDRQVAALDDRRLLAGDQR